MNLWLLAGSLVGVLALVAASRWLGLGGDARIDGRDDALCIARDNGFEAEDVAIDRAGMAALVRDAGGRFALIRRHGAHFVVALLTTPVDGRLDKRYLKLGKVTLDLGDDAAVWAASLRRMKP